MEEYVDIVRSSETGRKEGRCMTKRGRKERGE
jgi:hypothetical protein